MKQRKLKRKLMDNESSSPEAKLQLPIAPATTKAAALMKQL